MTWKIKQVSSVDLDALFALVEQFATSFEPRREAFDLSVQHIIADDSAWLRVVEYNGEIVGYCLGFDHYTFYANGRVAWIEEIMVIEKQRGMGIGRALVQAFEQWAISRGAKLVALATRRAAPFYSALGYEDSAVYFRKLL